jgi:hypothetical protein
LLPATKHRSQKLDDIEERVRRLGGWSLEESLPMGPRSRNWWMNPRSWRLLRFENQVHEQAIAKCILQPQEQRRHCGHYGMSVHAPAKETVEPAVLDSQTRSLGGDFQPLLREENKVMGLVRSPNRIAESPSAERVTQSTEHGHQTPFMNRNDMDDSTGWKAVRQLHEQIWGRRNMLEYVPERNQVEGPWSRRQRLGRVSSVDLYARILFSRLLCSPGIDLDAFAVATGSRTPNESEKSARSAPHVENGANRPPLLIHSLEQRLPLSAVESRVSKIVWCFKGSLRPSNQRVARPTFTVFAAK